MVAAVTAAAAVACTPVRGLGSLAYTRGGHRHVVDLDTCRDRVTGSAPTAQRPRIASPDGRSYASVRFVGGKQVIWVADAAGKGSGVLSLPRWKLNVQNGSPGPIMLLGWSGDSRWVFFAIDPGNSASIVADGIMLQAVSADGNGVRRIAVTLGSDDYRAWCGGRLVLTAGADRLAAHNKRLVVAAPPTWKARPLVRDPKRAFGSIACAPDGSVTVQSAPAKGTDMSSVFVPWSLYRVSNGRLERLTSPPTGYSDDSPSYSRDGTLFFVRSHHDAGRVYALRNGKLLGPFATLGPDIGFYGHHAWPYSVTR
jgi:hypothetical protein